MSSVQNIKQIPQTNYSYRVFIKLQQALRLQAFKLRKKNWISRNSAEDILFDCHAERDGDDLFLMFIENRQGWKRGDSWAVFLSTCRKTSAHFLVKVERSTAQASRTAVSLDADASQAWWGLYSKNMP